MRNLTLAFASAAVLLIPAAAQAQGLSSIFNCNNANNRQGSGAIVGALVGGLAGNQINDNDRTTGALVGAALGAAAGSYVGCQMSPADTGQAEAATLNALNQNRSTTWANGRTGASGRIDIVNSFNQANANGRDYDRGYDDRDGRGRGQRRDDYQSLNDVRFAPGVQQPVNYQRMDDRYSAATRVNLRAAPNTRGRVIGQLQTRESFDAIASVSNGDWLLVSRNGRAIGYVSSAVVRFVSNGPGDYAYNSRNRNRDSQYQQASQVCRTFDQTVQTRMSSGATSRPTTQRFTACQDSSNQWVLQS